MQLLTPCLGIDVLVLVLVSAAQLLLIASLWQSRSSGFVFVVIKDSPSQCGSSVPLFLFVFLPRAPSGLYIYYCFQCYKTFMLEVVS